MVQVSWNHPSNVDPQLNIIQADFKPDLLLFGSLLHAMDNRAKWTQTAVILNVPFLNEIVQ